MSDKKHKIPSDEAIATALKLPQGRRIKDGTATISDWMIVVLASESIQETWDEKKNS
jgi:hypothetical protein